MYFKNRIKDFDFRASFWETEISKAEIVRHCNAVFVHDEHYRDAKDDAAADMAREPFCTKRHVQGAMRRAANRVGWDKVAEVVKELTGVCVIELIPLAQYEDVIDAMRNLRTTVE